MSTFNTCLQEKEELSTEKWHELHSILFVCISYYDPGLNQLRTILKLWSKRRVLNFPFTIVQGIVKKQGTNILNYLQYLDTKKRDE